MYTTKKRYFSLGLVILMMFVCLFTACSEEESKNELERVTGEVVATVGDVDIYDYEVRFYAAYHGASADEVLDFLIESTRMMLFAEEKGVSVAEEDIKQAKESFEQEKEMYGEQFDSYLESVGLTEAEYRSVMLTSLRYSTAYASLSDLNALEGFGGEEVKAFYRDNFLRAKHVLIAFTDQEGNVKSEADALKQAQDVQKRLEDGENIDDLITELSDDPGSASAPDGYVFLDSRELSDDEKAALSSYSVVMVEPFTEGTAALENNGVSAPVKSEFGYHVIQRLDIDEEGIFEDNKSLVFNVMTVLNQEQFAQANDAFAAKLEKEYKAEIREEVMEKLRTEIDEMLSKLMQSQTVPAIQ